MHKGQQGCLQYLQVFRINNLFRCKKIFSLRKGRECKRFYWNTILSLLGHYEQFTLFLDRIVRRSPLQMLYIFIKKTIQHTGSNEGNSKASRYTRIFVLARLTDLAILPRNFLFSHCSIEGVSCDLSPGIVRQLHDTGIELH